MKKGVAKVKLGSHRPGTILALRRGDAWQTLEDAADISIRNTTYNALRGAYITPLLINRWAFRVSSTEHEI